MFNTVAVIRIGALPSAVARTRSSAACAAARSPVVLPPTASALILVIFSRISPFSVGFMTTPLSQRCRPDHGNTGLRRARALDRCHHGRADHQNGEGIFADRLSH